MSPRWRRRSFVSAAGFVTAMACWILWPKSDPRFVGRWEIQDFATLELGRGGTGWIRDNIEDWTWYFEWEVRDSRLILKQPDDFAQLLIARTIVSVRNQLPKKDGNRMVPAASVFDVPAAWKVSNLTTSEFRISPVPDFYQWWLGEHEEIVRRVAAN